MINGSLTGHGMEYAREIDIGKTILMNSVFSLFPEVVNKQTICFFQFVSYTNICTDIVGKGDFI